MKIDISDPGVFFGFFYVISFAITFVLFIIFSHRLKIPLRSVLLLLTTVTVCTIVGSRLSTIPVSEWGQLIVTGRFDGYHGRYAIGGLLFGLAGLVLSRHFLRINKSIINLYAWISPIGFGIQKMGCFFNGCCYGKSSDLPWSVQYPFGANAHYHHFLSGLIDADAEYSSTIHPVQLYEVIILLIIAFIVWKSQKFLKKTWSTLIFSLLLFSIFRFSMEFLRDPASSNFDSRIIMGISLIQWILLIMGLVWSVTLLLYERRRGNDHQSLPETGTSLRHSVLYLLNITAFIYIFRGLFSPFELISVYTEFIPAVLLTAGYLFRSLQTIRIKVAATPFIILPLFLITQTFSPDSVKQASVKGLNEESKSYKRIDLNTSFGDFYNTLSYNPQEGDCGTVYTHEDYEYLYRVGGAGLSFVKTEGKKMLTRGINIYGGVSNERNLTKQWEKTDFLFGINPFIKYDLNWVGFGAGAHLGNIRWVPAGPLEKQYFDRGTRVSPFLPEVLLRVGRRDILDLQYRYGFNLPTSVPVLLHEFSIGTGFGSKTDYNLRFGTAVSDYYSPKFITAEALLSKGIGLSFKYYFGGEDFYLSNNYPEFIERKGRIQFGANYRFGFK